MENKKISLFQMIMIITTCRISTIYIYLPALNSPPKNQDIWIIAITSIFYTFVMCYPLLYLSNKYEGFNLIEIMEKIFGKILGKIIGLAYVAFMLFVSVTLCGHILQFIGSAIMPETPYYAIIIFLLLICYYVAYKGIETIGRSSEIFAIFIYTVIISFTLFTISDIDFKMFLPILSDSTLSDINKGTINVALRFYDIIIIVILAPNLQKKSHINKTFFVSVLIYSIFALAMIISTQGILGVEQAKHAKFPYYLYSRQIDLFDFIQRIESITVIGWFLTVFVKFSTYIYSAAVSMKQIFNTKNYRGFIAPLSIVVYLGVMKTGITKSVIFSKIVSYEVFPYISVGFILIIPLISLCVYFIKDKMISK